MEEKKIIEGNRLIAEFMGIPTTQTAMDKTSIKEIIWGAIIESFDAESINGKKDYKAAVLDRAIKRIEALPTPDAVGITDEEIDTAARNWATSRNSTAGTKTRIGIESDFKRGASFVLALLSSKQTEAERILRELVRLKDMEQRVFRNTPFPNNESDQWLIDEKEMLQAARQWCIDNPEKV